MTSGVFIETNGYLIEVPQVLLRVLTKKHSWQDNFRVELIYLWSLSAHIYAEIDVFNIAKLGWYYWPVCACRSQAVLQIDTSIPIVIVEQQHGTILP